MNGKAVMASQNNYQEYNVHNYSLNVLKNNEQPNTVKIKIGVSFGSFQALGIV
jgi:hypothetical protein